MNKRKLPQGWHYEPLGEVAKIRAGTVKPGRLPNEVFYLYSIPAFDNGQQPEQLLGNAIKSNKTLVEPGDCLFSKLNPRIPRVWIVTRAEGDRQIASTEFLPVYPKIRDGMPTFIPEYIAYLFSWTQFREQFVGQVEASTKSRERLKPAQLLQQRIPLPPLPVQERIVQILQKADEIRRKRRKALELADKILPALFLEMFGDPATNPKGWSKEPIGNLVNFDTAQIRPVPGQTYQYLAPEYIESHTGQYTGPHPTDGQDLGSAKYHFTRDHVLYCKLRPYLNKVVLPHTDGVCSTELVPLRPGPKLLREFLAIYLRLPFFVATAVQKSQGTKMPRFGPELMKKEMMIVPPIVLQQSFCSQVNQLAEVTQRLKDGLTIASSSFDGLLSRAFTGELTAEWEAANAEWIAEQQALYERLPRLLVLALLVEKTKRARRAAAEVLVTALMKYTFLLQMEGNANHRRLYHFVPYHYGPFAKELYSDLEALEREGLVRVEIDHEEDKTRITLVDADKAEAVLAALPEDLKEDVVTIVETYGNLDHNALLQTVYEKYTAYAKKSQLKHSKKNNK